MLEVLAMLGLSAVAPYRGGRARWHHVAGYRFRSMRPNRPLKPVEGPQRLNQEMESSPDKAPQVMLWPTWGGWRAPQHVALLFRSPPHEWPRAYEAKVGRAAYHGFLWEAEIRSANQRTQRAWGLA